MEEQLFRACERGKGDKVSGILKTDETVDVNWKSGKRTVSYDVFGWVGESWTPLHAACVGDYLPTPSIFSLLLAHPDLDVNPKTTSGDTPFLWACRNGRTSCVQLLLKDARVKVNEPDNDGNTPLRWAASKGHLDIIKWWIASGREMDLGQRGNENTNAIGEAKKEKNTEEVSLLERFKENPEKTREQVRRELGITGQ